MSCLRRKRIASPPLRFQVALDTGVAARATSSSSRASWSWSSDSELTHGLARSDIFGQRDHGGMVPEQMRLAGMDEVEDGLQFGPSREGGAVAGLGADHGAARGLKRRRLGIEVLLRGRDPGIADSGG